MRSDCHHPVIVPPGGIHKVTVPLGTRHIRCMDCKTSKCIRNHSEFWFSAVKGDITGEFMQMSHQQVSMTLLVELRPAFWGDFVWVDTLSHNEMQTNHKMVVISNCEERWDKWIQTFEKKRGIMATSVFEWWLLAKLNKKRLTINHHWPRAIHKTCFSTNNKCSTFTKIGKFQILRWFSQ